MAVKQPLVLYNGVVSQLQSGDTIPALDLVSLTNGDTVPLTPGMLVYPVSASDVARCDATALAKSYAIGLMTQTTAVSAVGTVQDDGIVTLTTAQWDAVVTGESGGLTAGAVYWADPATKGFLISTPPSTATQFLVRVGVALSATQLNLDIQAPIGL